jgi:hypothetical protein
VVTLSIAQPLAGRVAPFKQVISQFRLKAIVISKIGGKTEEIGSSFMNHGNCLGWSYPVETDELGSAARQWVATASYRITQRAKDSTARRTLSRPVPSLFPELDRACASSPYCK